MMRNFESIFLAIYIIGFFFIIGCFLWKKINSEKLIKLLQADIKSKLESNFKLSSQDIVLLGRAYNLSPMNSRLALYRVYKDIKDPDSFYELKVLVNEIQKNEPFDTMPDEVKPSLLRISELIDISKSNIDKHLLNPIINIITKYQELEEDKKRTKKQNNIAYIISIVSFIVGAISLYFAIKAPNATEIAKHLKELTNP